MDFKPQRLFTVFWQKIHIVWLVLLLSCSSLWFYYTLFLLNNNMLIWKKIKSLSKAENKINRKILKTPKALISNLFSKKIWEVASTCLWWKIRNPWVHLNRVYLKLDGEWLMVRQKCQIFLSLCWSNWYKCRTKPNTSWAQEHCYNHKKT